jgi:hypothetical protein
MYPQTPPKRTNALNGQRAEDSGDHQVTNGGVGKPWSPLRTSDSAYRMFSHHGAVMWLTYQCRLNLRTA